MSMRPRETVSDGKTTQQLVRELLRDRVSMQPTDIANALSDRDIYVTADEATEYVRRVKKTLDETEQVLVAPAECKECGFDNWDSLTNIPSRCPECRSERITEPEFTIR